MKLKCHGDHENKAREGTNELADVDLGDAAHDQRSSLADLLGCRGCHSLQYIYIL